MKFSERIEYSYDPEIFTLQDTQTALRIHSEYIEKHSPRRPLPKFMEIDRSTGKFDHLWHVPLESRTAFSRLIDMPVILQPQKPDWRLTRVGVVPMQKVKVWMGHLLLQKADWWPLRGDMMVFNGYRHMLVTIEVSPESFWQQTNVWLGLVCTAVIPPEGDARPLLNINDAVPGEFRAPVLPPARLPQPASAVAGAVTGEQGEPIGGEGGGVVIGE